MVFKLVKPTKEDAARASAKSRAAEIIEKIKLEPSYDKKSELLGEDSPFEKIIEDTLYEFELLDDSKR